MKSGTVVWLLIILLGIMFGCGMAKDARVWEMTDVPTLGQLATGLGLGFVAPVLVALLIIIGPLTWLMSAYKRSNDRFNDAVEKSEQRRDHDHKNVRVLK